MFVIPNQMGTTLVKLALITSSNRDECWTMRFVEYEFVKFCVGLNISSSITVIDFL